MSDQIIVVKLSGHAVFGPDGTVHADYIRAFASTVSHRPDNIRCAVAVGGGGLAKSLIASARILGDPDSRASLIGGDVGHIAGRLVSASLRSTGVATPASPLSDFGMAYEAVHDGKVPVLCGWWPAITSDSVAAQFAEFAGASQLVKLSRVRAIYEHDPAVYPEAEALVSISHKELLEMCVQNDDRSAGSSFVLDVLAARTILRSSIPLTLVHYSRLDELANILAGGSAVSVDGTSVRSMPEGGA